MESDSAGALGELEVLQDLAALAMEVLELRRVRTGAQAAA